MAPKQTKRTTTATASVAGYPATARIVPTAKVKGQGYVLHPKAAANGPAQLQSQAFGKLNSQGKAVMAPQGITIAQYAARFAKAVQAYKRANSGNLPWWRNNMAAHLRTYCVANGLLAVQNGKPKASKPKASKPTAPSTSGNAAS